MKQYTGDVLAELEAQGTPPDMVQIGNEINHGLLWPDGHIGNLDQLAELLKAGVEAVREVDPDIAVRMHSALGGQNEESRFWLDNMVARGVQFDVIGLSYSPRWHATLDDLKANVHDLQSAGERGGAPSSSPRCTRSSSASPGGWATAPRSGSRSGASSTRTPGSPRTT